MKTKAKPEGQKLNAAGIDAACDALSRAIDGSVRMASVYLDCCTTGREAIARLAERFTLRAAMDDARAHGAALQYAGFFKVRKASGVAWTISKNSNTYSCVLVSSIKSSGRKGKAGSRAGRKDGTAKGEKSTGDAALSRAELVATLGKVRAQLAAALADNVKLSARLAKLPAKRTPAAKRAAKSA